MNTVIRPSPAESAAPGAHPVWMVAWLAMAVHMIASAANAQIQLGPRPGVAIVGGTSQQQVTLPSDAELAAIDVPAELVRLARALDAEHYSDRSAARTAILARRPSQNELMALLLRRDLGDEARQALIGILRERILKSPRGALGIRMETMLMREEGVRITGVIAGMPAEKVLQVGDLVVEVNGSALRDRNDLIRVVQSLEPGDEVRVKVRRVRRDEAGKVIVDENGAEATETLDVKMRLGSTEDLDAQGDPLNPIAPNPLMLNPAVLGREAIADAAAERFLPKPRVVPVRRAISEPANSAPLTVDSLRQLLVEFQLGGGNPDLVRQFRARIDAIERQVVAIAKTERAPDDRARFEAAVQSMLESIEAEIRGAR
ncbi:MAG: PDZ domain-containing protein [bacterium]